MSDQPSARPETVDLRTSLLQLVSDVADRGERELPSLRDLAQQYGVAPNTVKKLLLELEGPLQVIPVHGRGFFLHLPGDPPIAHGATASNNDTTGSDPIGHIAPDTGYSPVPEEGRALRKEMASQHDTVLVVGQHLRATDPTGAPGARFQLFLQMRQTLQHMGYNLAWAPLSYDAAGTLNGVERKAFELQVAGLAERLAGILLIDPGYGREIPAWEVAAEVTNMPVVWFHSAPLDPTLAPQLPPHCHVLEPEWDEVGRTMGQWLLENHKPEKILVLPPPGEKHLSAHLEAMKQTLIDGWGSRWVMTLDWFDVFPQGIAMRPANTMKGRLHRALLNSGLTRFELDRFFRVARNLRSSLWACSDDLLALAAIDHFDALKLPNEPRPGILGFGNHPFSLARGLCTVDFSWPSFIERGVELLSGYGRRSRIPRYTVIPAPSHSMYGGTILARNEDWW